MSKTIEKKCWSANFAEIAFGRRTADIRREDGDDFQIGDTLILREFIPEHGMWTGKFFKVEISNVQRCCPGLEVGYCVLSYDRKPSAEGFDVVWAGKFAEAEKEVERQKERAALMQAKHEEPECYLDAVE